MIRSTKELFSKFPWMRDYPNMARYVLKYGTDDLIQIPFVAKDIKSAEKIYKKCNESGKTWHEILKIGDIDEGITL